MCTRSHCGALLARALSAARIISPTLSSRLSVRIAARTSALVGSLFASCFQQTLCFKALQHGFQQQHLCRSCEQTSPKFREHREIKSRICQIQRESIFPVNSATNSLCRLPIREPFNKLENTDQCELQRRFGRPASLGEERGKLLIGIQGT